MSLASSISSLATTIANYIRDSIKPRLLPAGGASGYVLAKSAATDYSTGWVQGWTSANFNPDTKANLSGASFTGTISAPSLTVSSSLTLAGYGTNGFAAGNGDGASYATHNVRLTLWNGMGIAAYDGTINGFYDARAGRWDTKAAPRVNGVDVWHPGNFAPGNYAPLAGAAFTGGISTTGDVSANGRLIVGVGVPYSYIEMRDTDEGTRYIHNNSGTIGFLGSDGGWKMRVYDSGAIWTAQIGDLSQRIEDRANAYAAGRVSKAGDTMTGNLTIGKNYPGVTLVYGNVRQWTPQVRDDGNFYLWDDNGGNWSARFDTSGNIIARNNVYVGNAGSFFQFNGDIYMGWRGDYLSTVMFDKATGNQQNVNCVPSFNGAALDIVRGGVLRARWLVDGGGTTILQNGDNGDNFFYVTNGGSIWTKQFGDLNSRIESRARAWADLRNTRLSFAGDLSASWNIGNGIAEPYAGAVMTSRATLNSGGNYFWDTGRWRYLQQQGTDFSWYTVGYV